MADEGKGLREAVAVVADDKTINTALFDLTKVPCFRQSTLAGLGMGAGAGVIRFASERRPMAAANFGVKVWAAVTLGAWGICRYQYYNKREVLARSFSEANKARDARLQSEFKRAQYEAFKEVADAKVSEREGPRPPEAKV